MKIQRSMAQDLGLKLESVAKIINQRVGHLGFQDPIHVLEQLQAKAEVIFKLFKSSTLGSKILGKPVPLTRNQVRKKVLDNLEEAFQNPEIIELVTDSIYQAAKNDPKYRQLLN